MVEPSERKSYPGRPFGAYPVIEQGVERFLNSHPSSPIKPRDWLKSTYPQLTNPFFAIFCNGISDKIWGALDDESRKALIKLSYPIAKRFGSISEKGYAPGSVAATGFLLTNMVIFCRSVAEGKGQELTAAQILSDERILNKTHDILADFLIYDGF
ncbi:MAG: hypothetical protein Q7U68_05325 [Candidatus Roizmanbacteria bacterium]|nr:hypothetical protein [Candidatus Roizmanbacteria bacterium]